MMINCAMCGYEFDSLLHRACASCPLQKGCEMVCCPACGYQTIDARRSGLARLAGSVLSLFMKNASERIKGVELTLIDVPTGRLAQVSGFSTELPAARQAQLQAYGLAEKEWVRVLQHSPVTVIQIDHTELALEGRLASQIIVERIVTEKRDEDRR